MYDAFLLAVYRIVLRREIETWPHRMAAVVRQQREDYLRFRVRHGLTAA